MAREKEVASARVMTLSVMKLDRSLPLWFLRANVATVLLADCEAQRWHVVAPHGKKRILY